MQVQNFLLLLKLGVVLSLSEVPFQMRAHNYQYIASSIHAWLLPNTSQPNLHKLRNAISFPHGDMHMRETVTPRLLYFPTLLHFFSMGGWHASETDDVDLATGHACRRVPKWLYFCIQAGRLFFPLCPEPNRPLAKKNSTMKERSGRSWGYWVAWDTRTMESMQRPCISNAWLSLTVRNIEHLGVIISALRLMVTFSRYVVWITEVQLYQRKFFP